jgi:hypothetical protein
MDARLSDSRPLPLHLSAHERKASRVDVEALYADSPIDSSLFSLYIQQNYTQYCETLDECDGVAEMLSWVDASSAIGVSGSPSFKPLVGCDECTHRLMTAAVDSVAAV